MISVGIASPQKTAPFPYLGKEKPRLVGGPRVVPAYQAEAGAPQAEMTLINPAAEPAEALASLGGTKPARGKEVRPAALLKRNPRPTEPVTLPTSLGPDVRNAGSAAGPKTSTPPAAPTKLQSAELPKMAKGDVVLAPETEGWFEAIVQEVKPDDQVVLKWRDWPDEPVITRPLNQCTLLPEATATSPCWADIKADTVVVANFAPKEGWFEAVVVEMPPGGRIDLKWQGEPDDPMFARARDELALLPVGYVAKGAAT